MPSDFDFAETDEEVPEVPRAPVAAVAAPVAPTNNQALREDEPVQLDETEHKMLKLQFYWDLLGMQFFDSDHPVAIEVEEEMKAYAKSVVNAMMGGGAPKKRGRKPAQPAPVVVVAPAPVVTFENKGRRTATRAVEGRGGGRRDAARPRGPASALKTPIVVPPGTNLTGEEIIQQITAPDGQLREKIYKKAVDNESGRVYYLGFDRNNGHDTGDGNKYEMGVNGNGGQYFRVISQQSLPPGMAKTQPMTFAQISAISEQHAQTTMASVRKNNLLFQAIELAQKG